MCRIIQPLQQLLTLLRELGGAAGIKLGPVEWEKMDEHLWGQALAEVPNLEELPLTIPIEKLNLLFRDAILPLTATDIMDTSPCLITSTSEMLSLNPAQ